MAASDRYDLVLTKDEVSHGLIADWAKGGAGLTVEKPSIPQSTQVSTKGSYGVRDANDFFRIIQTDWSEGAGQGTYDMEADSESAFASSVNIDVSERGKFKLGPAATWNADVNTSTACVAGLKDGSGNPLVWRGDLLDTDAATTAKFLVYSKDGATWTHPAAHTGHPTAAPTSLCTDGAFVYGIFAGVAFKATIADIDVFTAGTNANLVNCAITAGVLYADNSTTDQLGCFGTAGAAWVPLSPVAGGAINLDGGTAFGLVSSGNYVYWGVTNGMVTKVYKAMFVDGAGNDILTLVATFPTGFIGASMYAYLGTVYVGGHFDADDAGVGNGAIYAIVSDSPALLTDIGDKYDSWSVVAISSYERALYFLANGHIYRWDLVVGGYTHVMDVTAGETLSTPSSWTKTWTMAAAPAAPASITNVSTTAAYDGTLTLTQNDHADSFRIDEAVTFDDSTGETLEVDLPIGYFSWQRSGIFAFGIFGNVKDVRVRLWTVPGQGYMGVLRTGATKDIAAFGPLNPLVASTFRLTLQNTDAVLSCNGSVIASGKASVARDAGQEHGVWIRATDETTGGVETNSTFKVSEVRWSVDGIFDPSFMPTITGNSMTCARDKVWALVQDATLGGCQTTSTTTYSLSGSLTSSRSAGGMPTVDKWFSSIDVQLDGPLYADCALTISGYIDGDGFGPISGTLYDGNLLSFPVGRLGRNISWTLSPSTTDAAQTPEVAEVAVLFVPAPKTAKLCTYFIRCWDGVEDRIGGDWDENAGVVADFLEDCANSIVTVERPGRSSYTGKVEGLELLEAPPSGKANGREGTYRVDVRDVG